MAEKNNAFAINFPINETTYLRGQGTECCFDVTNLEKVILQKAKENLSSTSLLKTAVQCMDLTSLAGNDTPTTIDNLCKKAMDPLPGLNYDVKPAAVCVYGTRVKDAIVSLHEYNSKNPRINVAAVAGGFPSGQLPLELKLKEVEYAVEQGADEIDVVINRTLVLTGKWGDLHNELKEIRKQCSGAVMKTILATGELESLENVYLASKTALLSGTDFIKTSTGKEAVNATVPASIVMCIAIKEHCEEYGDQVGFKPAGGIKTSEEAITYLTLVQEILGEGWLNPELFRLGASSLLSHVEGRLKALSEEGGD